MSERIMSIQTNRSILFMLVLVFITAGCETMGDNTKKGAGIGALGGAAVGAIVGHQEDREWEGALIGAAAGATIGGIVGNRMDKRQLASNPSHLTVVRIAEMASDGVPDSVIIDDINRTKSEYELNAEMINYLKDNNVSDRVIDHMLATGR